MICGIDEVGRGPLSGPVVSCAVILNEDFDTSDLKDSKQLSEKKRLLIELDLLKSGVFCFGLGAVSNIDIDKINIHNASLLSMKRAFFNMLKNKDVKPSKILIDGKFVPDIDNFDTKAIVRGDTIINSIMAASILAKNYRDKLMINLSKIYPNYGFERHKGYPTKLHKQRIAQYGLSKIHRRSFKSS